MAIRVVQLGTPRAPGEGLRLGTVRRPPRGVPRTDYPARDFYDVWLPELAPSEQLVKLVRGARERRHRSLSRDRRADRGRLGPALRLSGARRLEQVESSAGAKRASGRS